MKIHWSIVILVIFVFVTACGTQASPASEPDIVNTATDVPGEHVVETPAPPEVPAPVVETVGPDCLGDEINPIGQSIAEDFESATYEKVMTWFCNGAEFEDILVALETETHVDTSAEEMLEMLADGFTWEEIWQLVGLTD